MSKTRIILLPGLHGTEELFGPFLECAPNEFDLQVVSFPRDEVLSYDALLERVERLFQESVPTILLGESFSGPLALMVAARAPNGLIGLILVASFVLPPASPLLRFLPWNLIFHLSVPLYLIRILLANSKDAAIIKKSGDILRRTSPAVLAARIRSTLTVNATTALQSCAVPVLYLAADRDLIVRRNSLKNVISLRPDVIVERIEAPHFLLQYAPHQAWQAVVPFISKCAKHD